MNVIVSNKYKDLLNSLDFDISKNLNGEFTVDEIIQNFSTFFFNRMFLDITAIKDYKNLQNIQKLSINLDVSKIILFLDDVPDCLSPQFLSNLVSMGFYNFTTNKEGLIYLYNHPNLYRDVAHLHNLNNNMIITNDNNTGMLQKKIQQKDFVPTIIGVKNLTTHAGATTLVYMLQKVLSDYYNVQAIEVNKRDFIFLRDKNLLSITEMELKKVVNNISSNNNIVIIDLNDCDEGICTDVIYLIEPSTIKLNKLIMLNKNVFYKYGSKKIILNKCMLSSKDINELENECNIKVFCDLPPINDRSDYKDLLIPIIYKLGLIQKQ